MEPCELDGPTPRCRHQGGHLRQVGVLTGPHGVCENSLGAPLAGSAQRLEGEKVFSVAVFPIPSLHNPLVEWFAISVNIVKVGTGVKV